MQLHGLPRGARLKGADVPLSQDQRRVGAEAERGRERGGGTLRGKNSSGSTRGVAFLSTWATPARVPSERQERPETAREGRLAGPGLAFD